jgi:tape measure domain-containing protein
VTDRVIRVVLDASGVERGARAAQGASKKVKTSADQMRSGFRAAAKAAAGLAVVLGFRELIRTADTFNQIQNSLRIVTDSTDELVSANQRLFEIAQRTRTPLEATVSLFSRASIAAEELGASQEELFRLTEITGQALAVQGGAASEAAGALRQLSQSFSSGIVRAEEFNSILEGAFPLAQAAARGFGETGISVGKLRNLVVEGKVSSEEFFRAILKGGEGLAEQFEQTVPTVGQALVVLNNAFITFVGGVDGASGATATLAQILIDVAGVLGDLGDALTGNLDPLNDTSAGFNTFAVSVIAAGSAISSLFDILRTGKEFFVAFAEGLGGVAAGIVQLAKGNFTEARAIFSDTTGFDRATLATTDFFENFSDNIDSASLRINDVLVPSFRMIREEVDKIADAEVKDIVNPNAVEDLQDATDATQEFLEALRITTGELAIQAQLGDDADEAIRRYREGIELAAAANEAFGDLVPTAEVEELTAAFIRQGEAGLETQRALREEIEAAELAQTFQEQIEALEEEILLLDASNEAIAINAEVRALAEGATAEQAAQIRNLTEALLDEKDALSDNAPTIQQFIDDTKATAEDTLTGILADPMADGLDELPFKFAQTLQALAAQALSAEVFEILGSLGGGGGGGGFLGFLGGLFGSAQAGGQISSAGPTLVGERGPELFTPASSGTISPNVNINQAAQAPPMVNVINVSDPADIPSGIETPEGEQAVINVIQKNPEAVRRLLG